MNVRRAHPSDSAAIAAVYNEGIEDRVATFETQLRTPKMSLRGSMGVIPSWSAKKRENRLHLQRLQAIGHATVTRVLLKYPSMSTGDSVAGASGD